MGKDHKGKPSGAGKEEGSGLRPDMPQEKLEKNEEMTNKYTRDEDELQENIRMRHPNRNTDKDDATNAGGYKQ